MVIIALNLIFLSFTNLIKKTNTMNFKRTLYLFSLVISIVFIACQQQYRASNYSGGNLTLTDSIKSDSLINAQILPFKNEIDEQMNKIIGYTDKDLNVNKPESDLSNLLADILQMNAKEFVNREHADSLSLFSLINIKGIRASIQKGDIAVRNIFEVMPFENEIVILELSGDTIIKFFNFLAQTEGDGLSGARLVISNNRAKEIEINNLKIDTALNYYLATSDYLANGGDHYSMITSPIKRMNTGVKIREAMIEYVTMQTKMGKKINAQVDGRITYFKN